MREGMAALGFESSVVGVEVKLSVLGDGDVYKDGSAGDGDSDVPRSVSSPRPADVGALLRAESGPSGPSDCGEPPSISAAAGHP